MSAPTPIPPTPKKKKKSGGGGFVYPYIFFPVTINLNTSELFDKNGNSINSDPNKRVSCDPDCLVAYPDGSQYHGYYYCNKSCGVFHRTVSPQINVGGITYDYDTIVENNSGVKFYRYKINPIFNRYASSWIYPK